MLRILLAACFLQAKAKNYFKESFDALDAWTASTEMPDFWRRDTGSFWVDKADTGLSTTRDSTFYSISAKIDSFDHAASRLVLQYTVKFDQNIDCGGGYIKLLPSTHDQLHFGSGSMYNIMFGPDICGSEHKTHLIIRHRDVYYDNTHWVPAIADQLTRLVCDLDVYTLVIDVGMAYRVMIDGRVELEGDLLKDYKFLKEEKILDMNATKPVDWPEPLIRDPNAPKPQDWDEREFIPDPEAQKPLEWDDEADGEWEPNMVPNPMYQGEWQNLVPNPAYTGPWIRPMVDNPEYETDDTIYQFVSEYVGIEVWQVKSGTIFDNILITDSVQEMEDELERLLEYKKKEMKAKEVHDRSEMDEMDEMDEMSEL